MTPKGIRFIGKILCADDTKATQHRGRGNVFEHRQIDLERKVKMGEFVDILYPGKEAPPGSLASVSVIHHPVSTTLELAMRFDHRKAQESNDGIER